MADLFDSAQGKRLFGFIAAGGTAGTLLGSWITSAVVVQAVFRAARYAIAQPAREILFTVVSREEKYKAKSFIDTVVYRGGDAATAWMFHGIQSLGLGLAGLAALGLPLAALGIAAGVLLGRAPQQRSERTKRRTRKNR